MMKIIISPRESCSKIILSDVELCWSENEDICILFVDGTVRKYPKQHIWYIEFNEKENKPLQK